MSGLFQLSVARNRTAIFVDSPQVDADPVATAPGSVFVVPLRRSSTGVAKEFAVWVDEYGTGSCSDLVRAALGLAEQ